MRPESRPVVLFDLDGTLIDSAPDLAAAADAMRVDRGLDPLGAAAYRRWVGSGARGVLGVALDVAPGHTGYERLKAEFLERYAQALCVHTQLFPGVREALDALARSDQRWGIVTNKAQRFALPLIERLAPLDAASVIVCGDSTPHPKPHPAPLLQAARALGADARLCLYVGDDERDVAAGRAAGMKTVAAAYGYLGQAPDVHAWRADAHINHPHELLTLLPLNRGRST